MYFYDSVLLICNILILMVQTQAQNVKGPGISACSFMSFVEDECGFPDVKVTDIPEECTSVFFDGVYVDLRYHVFADPCSCTMNRETLEHLDEILKSNKRTYVYYGHVTQSEWTQVLACEACNGGINSLDEMKGVKAFLDEHPGITGLVITALELDSYSIPFPGYSENLKKYLEVMKTSFPTLEIGIQFDGFFLIDQFNNPKLPWLDLKVIVPATDFFVVNAMNLNACTPDFVHSGIAPISSSCTDYTMEKLKCVLTQSSVPNDKTYFKFRVNPIFEEDESLTRCNLTNQEYCSSDSKKNTDKWCADTMTTFQDKGKFTKDNGAGFITSCIDLNDPTNKCSCEKPYGSFYALLGGFNGVPTKPCGKYLP